MAFLSLFWVFRACYSFTCRQIQCKVKLPETHSVKGFHVPLILHNDVCQRERERERERERPILMDLRYNN